MKVLVVVLAVLCFLGAVEGRKGQIDHSSEADSTTNILGYDISCDSSKCGTKAISAGDQGYALLKELFSAKTAMKAYNKDDDFALAGLVLLAGTMSENMYGDDTYRVSSLNTGLDAALKDYAKSYPNLYKIMWKLSVHGTKNGVWTEKKVGGLTLQQWFDAGAAGKFGYLRETDGVCNLMNLFAEFWSFGNVEEASGKSEYATTCSSDIMKSQYKCFWDTQKSVVKSILSASGPGGMADLYSTSSDVAAVNSLMEATAACDFASSDPQTCSAFSAVCQFDSEYGVWKGLEEELTVQDENWDVRSGPFPFHARALQTVDFLTGVEDYITAKTGSAPNTDAQTVIDNFAVYVDVGIETAAKANGYSPNKLFATFDSKGKLGAVHERSL